MPIQEKAPKVPSSFSAHIKDIWLELPNYEFETEVGANQENSKWIGREFIEAKLSGYLESKSNTGAYLITGYRGMGKTSFVKKITQQYKKSSKQAVKIITISFGQKDIKELDILRQILQGIKEHLLDERIEWFHTKFLTLKSLPFWTCIFFISLLFWVSSGNVEGALSTVKNWISLEGATQVSGKLEAILSMLIVSTVISYFFLQIMIFGFKFFFYRVRIYDKVADLYERSNSQVTTETGAEGSAERFPFGFINKLIKKYPVANPKEIENEIIEILKKINSAYPMEKTISIIALGAITAIEIFLIWHILFPVNYDKITIDWDIWIKIIKIISVMVIGSYICKIIFKKLKKLRDFILIFKHRKFVFVFDEIDKIDPSPFGEKYHEEMDQFEKAKHGSDVYESRERRRIVINILANLKYLITTAEAKFIFIAGREMFDAALADISDRQSAISSIFHQVINVDSFLKEESNHTKYQFESGLTLLIEEYLERIMLPGHVKNDDPFLKKYHTYLENQNIDHIIRYKIIYTLDRFITYLTYRSNGSPKKLIRLIEDIIKPSSENFNYSWKEDMHSFTVLYCSNNGVHSQVAKKIYFLHFDILMQYKIGFITYLTKPFLVSFGNYFKAYSEKILVATPYLFDHIIKFHPFAFSLHNLELVPEVISETRPPELRSFLETLVTYLSQTHIRETEIGLFEYKFLNKTLHEISYLSKIYEDESAAFNFTLDETYHVKLFLRNKIKELRSIYKYFLSDSNVDLINSILFLNDQLGDLHFFDQEYDEAIVAYYDALQVLNQKLTSNVTDNINLENFIRYLSLRLKLGLTFEKMKSYETAMALYSETSAFSIKFLASLSTYSDLIPSMKDLVQILVQPLLAGLFVQEKFSAEGTTLNMVLKTERLFYEIMRLTAGKDINYLIKSNFYSSLSTLFFYKNSFERESEMGAETQINSPLTLNENSFDLFFPIMGKDNFGNSFRDYRVSNSSFNALKESLIALLNYLDDDINASFSLLQLLRCTEDYLSTYIDIGYILYVETNRFRPRKFKNDKTFFKNFALILSKLGDSIFSGLTENRIDLVPSASDNTKLILHYDVFDSLNDRNAKGKYWSFYSFDDATSSAEYNFQIVLCIYFWAANYFSRAGKNTHVSFMYRKIFHVFHLIASFKTIHLFRNQLENYFLREILKATTWSSNSSDRYQLFTFKNVLNIKEAHHPIDKSKYDYLNTSTSPEVKEAVVLYSLLRVATFRYEIEEVKIDIKKNELSEKSIIEKESINKSLILTHEGIFKERDNIAKLISPYNTISSQYSRYLELALQVKINESIDNNNDDFRDIYEVWSKVLWARYKNLYGESNSVLRTTLREKIIEELGTKINLALNTISDDKKREIFQNYFKFSSELIIHSMYCLTGIIKIYNDIAVNPFFSYSSLGYYHEKLGNCIRKFELLKFFAEHMDNLAIEKDFLNDVLDAAKTLLGAEFVHTMDSITQYQFAIQNYSKARQFHNDGVPYKTQILNMYYLEDDFNDGLYHFGIAMERQRINSGNLREKITRMQKEIRESQLYKYVSYVNDF